MQVGVHSPVCMIADLAMGSKHFDEVGTVDGETPGTTAFEIDWISACRIDEH